MSATPERQSRWSARVLLKETIRSTSAIGRCPHGFQRGLGLCYDPACPEWDGASGAVRATSAGNRYRGISGDWNGRTELVFARVDADWGRFRASNAADSSREYAALRLLIRQGRVERRGPRGRSEYRRVK